MEIAQFIFYAGRQAETLEGAETFGPLSVKTSDLFFIFYKSFSKIFECLGTFFFMKPPGLFLFCPPGFFFFALRQAELPCLFLFRLPSVSFSFLFYFTAVRQASRQAS
jgi:hypothetical protein